VTRDVYADVRAFTEKFTPDVIGTEPRPLPKDTEEFRLKFIYEELEEYERAIDEGDLAKQFDALLDLTYVIVGNAIIQGFPWHEGWDLVQAANMAKQRAQRADESKRGTTYDVIKGPGWTAPDIEGLLAKKS
jgi:predicted HAD superfamily Cof-like phosphohydrolase